MLRRLNMDVIWSGSLDAQGQCPSLTSYLCKPGAGSCLADAIPDQHGNTKPKPASAYPPRATAAQLDRATEMLINKYPHRQIAAIVGLTPNQVRRLKVKLDKDMDKTR